MRSRRSAASAARRGWYYGDALWQLRGLLDLCRRRRRAPPRTPRPETPAVGSTLDFWRVEAYEPDRLLRLRAEMRLPGRAWLQFEVDGDEDGSTIGQTAIFDPSGLSGLVYWYALLPLHGLVFRGMLAGIAAEATGGETRVVRVPPRRAPRDRGHVRLLLRPGEPPAADPARARLPQRRAAGANRARLPLPLPGRPVDWVAEIADWDPPAGFADVQVRGPYRVWRHRHELTEVAAGTEVRDHVEYRLRGGPVGRLLEPLHCAFLRTLFSYRSRRLDELLG